MSKKLLMKPLKVLASPGIYLFGKYNQYKRERQQSNVPSTPAENELSQLNTKIDKLLNKLNGKYAEIASTPEEECVICVNAKAVMQTYPCGHKVVCRRCFVKTIQIALTQRTLPLRCVICRAKILRLKHSQNNKVSSIPPFQSRSFSSSTSKRSSSETVSKSCLFESNPWPRVTKYSRSLPGISEGSFRSVVYHKSSANSMRKCCRSYSLSSWTSDKGPQQKTSVVECRQSYYEQNFDRRKINENSRNEEKETSTDRNRSTELVSREKLIQQFQRDFKEGQLLSSRSSITRTKPPVNKLSSVTPNRNLFTKEVKSNQKADVKYSNMDKRKNVDNILAQENPKYREKQCTKLKDKCNTKTMKLIKLEKKDKNKSINECSKNVKNYRKEKKNEKKLSKVK